mmetsp:Transcript_18478/g.46278  ORF Transcript_18478/g.46278 Transcript_18478/m.46278 type:complete len:117 (+) Transcript_18478:27-377(+)
MGKCSRKTSRSSNCQKNSMKNKAVQATTVESADLRGMVQLPQSVFEHMLNKNIIKHVRPPTKRHRGKRLRQSKPILTTESTWQSQLSMEIKGLPQEVCCNSCGCCGYLRSRAVAGM